MDYRLEMLRHSLSNLGLPGARDTRQNGEPLALKGEEVVGDSFARKMETLGFEGMDQGGERPVLISA